MFRLLPAGQETRGAAIATMLSNLISLLYYGAVLFLGRKHSVLSFRPCRAMLEEDIPRSVLTAGLPACLMTLLENLSFAVLEHLMSLQGIAVQAGIGVAKKGEYAGPLHDPRYSPGRFAPDRLRLFLRRPSADAVGRGAFRRLFRLGLSLCFLLSGRGPGPPLLPADLLPEGPCGYSADAPAAACLPGIRPLLGHARRRPFCCGLAALLFFRFVCGLAKEPELCYAKGNFSSTAKEVTQHEA